MKITIQQYGSSMIALSIFALLLGICMSLLENNSKYASDFSMFAEKAIAEHFIQEHSIGETSAFDVYRNQTLPEIYSYGRYEIRTGEYTPIASCFYGKDREGNDIPVKVNEILDGEEQSINTVIWNDVECFYFERQGIYRLILETEDKNQKKQMVYAKIFVNGALNEG